MKQYFAVFGIAVIALAMIGTTTTMTYAVEKPSKPSRALQQRLMQDSGLTLEL